MKYCPRTIVVITRGENHAKFFVFDFILIMPRRRLFPGVILAIDCFDRSNFRFKAVVSGARTRPECRIENVAKSFFYHIKARAEFIYKFIRR